MIDERRKSQIQIYSSARCPYCHWAKRFFDDRKWAYEELRIDLDQQALDGMIAKTGQRSVPQIFIGNYHVGGYQDLLQKHQEGIVDKVFAKVQS